MAGLYLYAIGDSNTLTRQAWLNVDGDPADIPVDWDFLAWPEKFSRDQDEVHIGARPDGQAGGATVAANGIAYAQDALDVSAAGVICDLGLGDFVLNDAEVADVVAGIQAVQTLVENAGARFWCNTIETPVPGYDANVEAKVAAANVLIASTFGAKCLDVASVLVHGDYMADEVHIGDDNHQRVSDYLVASEFLAMTFPALPILQGAPAYPLMNDTNYPIALDVDFSRPERLYVVGGYIHADGGRAADNRGLGGFAQPSDPPYTVTPKLWAQGVNPPKFVQDVFWGGHSNAKFETTDVYENYIESSAWFAIDQPFHMIVNAADMRTGDWNGHQTYMISRPIGEPLTFARVRRKASTNAYEYRIRAGGAAFQSAKCLQRTQAEVLEFIYDGPRSEIWRNGVRIFGPTNIGTAGITKGMLIGALNDSLQGTSDRLEMGSLMIHRGNLSDQSGAPTEVQTQVQEYYADRYNVLDWGDAGLA